MRPEIKHWLNSKAIADSDTFPGSRPPVIRDLRGLVHRTAYSMASIISDYPITELLGVLLDRPTNVSHTVVWPAGFDPQIEALLGHPDKLFQFLRDVSYRYGCRRISYKSL
jgi:hypothetical protein